MSEEKDIAETEEVTETTEEKEEIILEEDLEETTEEDETKEVEVVEYEKAGLEDDGYMGVPVFTEKEIHILGNNLFMDVDSIQAQQQIMKDTLKMINGVDEEKEDLEESGLPTNTKESKDVYVSARNLLIHYQRAVDEYLGFIDENKDELLKQYKDIIDASVKEYIEESEAEFGIKYVENTFSNFLIKVGLERAIKNIDNGDDIIVNLLTKKYKPEYDLEFEKDILKTVEKAKFLLSNGQGHNDIKTLSTDEKQIIKICTGIVKKFKTMSIGDVNGEEFDFIKTRPERIIMGFLFSMSKLVKKRTYFDFLNEKKAFNSKSNRAKKNNSKIKIPLTNNFVKARFVLMVIEIYLKKWLSYSLYGDEKILEDKEKFLSVITTDAKITDTTVGLIDTFSYRFIFNEFCEIVSKIHTVAESKTHNFRYMNILKNYLMYVTYYRNSLDPHDYNLNESYKKYIDIIFDKIKEKRV